MQKSSRALCGKFYCIRESNLQPLLGMNESALDHPGWGAKIYCIDEQHKQTTNQLASKHINRLVAVYWYLA